MTRTDSWYETSRVNKQRFSQIDGAVRCVRPQLTSDGIHKLSIDQQLTLDLVRDFAVVNLLELRGCSGCDHGRSEGPGEVVNCWCSWPENTRRCVSSWRDVGACASPARRVTTSRKVLSCVLMLKSIQTSVPVSLRKGASSGHCGLPARHNEVNCAPQGHHRRKLDRVQVVQL